MIYWDIDGVLRNQSAIALGGYPNIWYVKVGNQDFMDYIDDHLEILEISPPTEYLKVAKEFEPILIISNQPKSWRPYTEKWLQKYINVAEIIWAEPGEKLIYLRAKDRLVEDYPYFKDYSQIILIDRPYNQDVPAKIRICTPKQLRKILEEVK